MNAYLFRHHPPQSARGNRRTDQPGTVKGAFAGLAPHRVKTGVETAAHKSRVHPCHRDELLFNRSHLGEIK